MANKGSPGISHLAKVLSDRAREEGSNAPRPSDLDYGVINKDYSLTLNKFTRKIPKSDYHVLRHISGEKMGTTRSANGPDAHSHTIYYPKLKPGTRVLVAWVESSPVIIDVVTKFA